MSGIFMSDPRWTYEDPTGLPELPAAAPASANPRRSVTRRASGVRFVRPVPTPRAAS